MRMFLDDGTYWATLLKPSPAPDHVEIGPYKFVKDGGAYIHKPDVTLADDAHRGAIRYITEPKLENKHRSEIGDGDAV